MLTILTLLFNLFLSCSASFINPKILLNEPFIQLSSKKYYNHVIKPQEPLKSSPLRAISRQFRQIEQIVYQKNLRFIDCISGQNTKSYLLQSPHIHLTLPPYPLTILNSNSYQQFQNSASIFYPKQTINNRNLQQIRPQPVYFIDTFKNIQPLSTPINSKVVEEDNSTVSISTILLPEPLPIEYKNVSPIVNQNIITVFDGNVLPSVPQNSVTARQNTTKPTENSTSQISSNKKMPDPVAVNNSNQSNIDPIGEINLTALLNSTLTLDHIITVPPVPNYPQLNVKDVVVVHIAPITVQEPITFVTDNSSNSDQLANVNNDGDSAKIWSLLLQADGMVNENSYINPIVLKGDSSNNNTKSVPAQNSNNPSNQQSLPIVIKTDQPADSNQSAQFVFL